MLMSSCMPESLSEFLHLLGCLASVGGAGLLCQRLLDGCLELIRKESSGTSASGVTELAVGSDEIESVRPALVGLADLVVDLVDDGGNHVQPQIHDALAGHSVALIGGYGILDDRTTEVGAPAIDRVCFLDVDEQELDVLAISLVEGLQPTG
jgi:hypothetical protein